MMSVVYHYRFFGMFRLLLALLVAISHLQDTHAPLWAGNKLVHLGAIGVNLFFVVSGFVIAEALATFYRGRAGAFLVNRFLRIYPAYLVACGLMLCAAAWLYLHRLPLLGVDLDYYAAVNWRTLLLNLFALYDYNIPAAKNNYFVYVGPVWSLVIEWQFYMVAALFCLFSTKWKSAYMTSYGFVGLLLLMYICGRLNFVPAISVFSFIQFFLLGTLAYEFYRNTNLSARIFTMSFAVLLMVGMSLHLHRTAIQPSGAIAIIVGVLSVWLLAFLSEKVKASWWLRRLDVACGNLSYPLFLNHGIAQVLWYAYIPERSWGWLCFSVVLSLFIAIVAYVITEPFLQRVRDKIRGQKLSYAT
jgi:peptidoglycan/LPS O-acetylase OafA/YrhL